MSNASMTKTRAGDAARTAGTVSGPHPQRTLRSDPAIRRFRVPRSLGADRRRAALSTQRRGVQDVIDLLLNLRALAIVMHGGDTRANAETCTKPGPSSPAAGSTEYARGRMSSVNSSSRRWSKGNRLGSEAAGRQEPWLQASVLWCRGRSHPVGRLQLDASFSPSTASAGTRAWAVPSLGKADHRTRDPNGTVDRKSGPYCGPHPARSAVDCSSISRVKGWR